MNSKPPQPSGFKKPFENPGGVLLILGLLGVTFVAFAQFFNRRANPPPPNIPAPVTTPMQSAGANK